MEQTQWKYYACADDQPRAARAVKDGTCMSIYRLVSLRRHIPGFEKINVMRSSESLIDT